LVRAASEDWWSRGPPKANQIWCFFKAIVK
jgi:hypothetical protein